MVNFYRMNEVDFLLNRGLHKPTLIVKETELEKQAGKLLLPIRFSIGWHNNLGMKVVSSLSHIAKNTALEIAASACLLKV